LVFSTVNVNGKHTLPSFDGVNIRAVLDDEASINLGSVYESVVASELIAQHSFHPRQ